MKTDRIIKSLGKKQRYLLKVLDEEPLGVYLSDALEKAIRGLKKLNLIESTENYIYLTLTAKEIIQVHRAEIFDRVPDQRDEILNRLINNKPETPSKLKKRERLFLLFLLESPRKKEEVRAAKAIVPTLLEKGLIAENDGGLLLTESGRIAAQETTISYSVEDVKKIFLAAGKIRARKAIQDKAELFLSLYRLGLTYQEIGDVYNLSRERVRQILNKSPNFESYLEEYEKAKAERELEREKDSKIRAIEKSLAVRFSDRVDELWDWEKNGDINPAAIAAHSASCEIWLKCPIDGHSWLKKPSEIVLSWERNKSSGCPVCARKSYKPQKQKTLTEVYPEFIDTYWNYKKNNLSGLEPKELTLGSNHKAWFTCPVDGNEWLANIAATVKQQWSKGNAGCRVCNGTASRRIGLWKKTPPIKEKFPEQVSIYWHFEKNKEKNLDPEEVTSGSSKEAWFNCPIDGCVWNAKIAAVCNSWKSGNSGCPTCRGFITSKTAS